VRRRERCSLGISGMARVPIGVYGETGHPSGQYECRGFGDSRFSA
jgi:hypothetical protein